MDNKSRALGCFLGLAIGDALGAPVEFSKPGTFSPIRGYRSGGPFNLKAGYWTDDTSMALCITHSLFEMNGEMDLHNQLKHYLDWYKTGKYSSTGECFDIGVGTRIALEVYNQQGVISTNEDSLGNGSLMRLAPVAIMYHNDPEKARLMSTLSATTTHGEKAALYTGELGYILANAINGSAKETLKVPALRITPPVSNSGYVIESIRAALHYFHTTDSFEECVYKAVNMGDDSDTVGAIAGQIAGAYYGIDNIPHELISGLFDSQYLLITARELYSLHEASVLSASISTAC